MIHLPFSLRAAFASLLAMFLCFLTSHAEIVLRDKVAPLPFPHQGPFVRTADGAIWGVDAKGALVSRDEGRNWIARNIFDRQRFEPSGERALFRTEEGVILFAFLNRKELHFDWNDAKGGPQEGCRIPVYLQRSVDDGVTWEAPVMLQDGWCGAVRQMIRLRSGRILLVCQKAMPNPGRHVTINYFSDDLGRTWRPSDVIDLGAAGNYEDPVTGLRASTHGGGLEGTVLGRADGSLRLLLRVPHGCFFESISKDGVTWSRPQPAPIESSDSPAMMVRLTSGRVALVWNRYRDPVLRRGRREQLSIAFSGNDGLTWTTPQVIATKGAAPPGQSESSSWISYPYVFEPTPGRLWISTMQGRLSASLAERDFLAPDPRTSRAAEVRIITLGDSITRGARPGVLPGQTFSARLQAALRTAGVAAGVHNVGIGGERTDQVLRRLARDVIAQRPDLVTVMYGTNDSWVDEGKVESRLTTAAYEANLREIVRQLRGAGIEVVLMTPPRFGERHRKNGLGEEANLRIGRYVERCRAVARDASVPLVDHFAGWAAAQQSGRLLETWTTDSCHPNPEGHADLAQRMLPVVLPLCRKLSSPP